MPQERISALPTAEAVGALRSTVAGPVHLRGEPGYADEFAGFNSTSPASPDLVVGATSEKDVQFAVRWAAANAVTVHPQATGHGAYRPLDHGMLLTTKRLDHLRVNAEAHTWTMGAGLAWKDILPSLHAAGLGAVTGSAPGVGPVGFTLGGGIGPIGRTFGMAGDWVRGYRVVLADGDVRVVTPEEHSDLFWALRGGKVGLGIVTEMTLEALPLPFIFGGGIYYPEAEIDRLLHAWIDWIPDLPDSVSTSVAIVRLPPEVPAPLGGRTWIHFRYAYAQLGATQAELVEAGEGLLASWREIAGPGVVDNVELRASDRLGEIHQDPTEPVALFEYGDFLRGLDHEFADGVLAHVGTGQRSVITSLEIRYHGGAYARPPKYPSAIGGRQAQFTFLVVGHPDEITLTTPAMTDAAFALRPLVEAWQADEVNVNWANPLTEEIFENRLWSPVVRDRLKEIRREVDPEGRFDYGFWG